MKSWVLRVLFGITVVFAVLGFSTKPISATGSCQNTTCDGLNPNTMGCPASRSGTAKVFPDSSYVETRSSGLTDCDAKWARLYNLSGSNRYAAASARYGCANYCYDKSVSSPAKISNGQAVYTPMLAYSVTWTRSCGSVGSTGPISTPIGVNDNYCTGAN